jgi:hypothetical protein
MTVSSGCSNTSSIQGSKGYCLIDDIRDSSNVSEDQVFKKYTIFLSGTIIPHARQLPGIAWHDCIFVFCDPDMAALQSSVTFGVVQCSSASPDFIIS